MDASQKAPRWRAGFAVGVPFTIALVLILNFTIGAISPNSKAHGAPRSVSRAQLAAVLMPAKAHSHRVVARPAASAPTPASTATLSPVGAEHPGTTHLHHQTGQSTGSASVGTRMAPARDAVLVPETTLVAHLSHSIPGYPSPNALQSNKRVPGSWWGYPSQLPIIGESGDRIHVRLAQRPDESTAWIDKSAAVITATHWAIVVDTAQHWLYVFRWGQQVGSFPVGNGAPGTPTPTGTYFIAFHAPPNGPGYGSVMLETSAHSRVIEHFEGGSDAIIAIHGPVGSDAEIGNHGAAISNGCIRMHEWDLRHVAPVLNGSPIYLVA
jgi:lipoprotein-anchoring transpeptidase ErfK/SrfK